MLKGVYKATKKDGTLYYRSSITHKSKHISLGSFDTELRASKAYEEANLILSRPSKTIDKYSSKKSILPFSKWVVLINFRDNGIYFKTPIYLMKNFFLYYLNKDEYLTFDNDDLFYYSTRTISRRGGHLFVADYGMQVNILSRYGIKNYGIENRDYIFSNGNKNDFRYENIVIINKYHGVFKKEKNGLEYYEARIHINGDFIVGKYDNEETAAIAYNKAADILNQKGFKKNFPQNYIETMTGKEYVETYSELEISKKIAELVVN